MKLLDRRPRERPKRGTGRLFGQTGEEWKEMEKGRETDWKKKKEEEHNYLHVCMIRLIALTVCAENVTDSSLANANHSMMSYDTKSKCGLQNLNVGSSNVSV